MSSPELVISIVSYNTAQDLILCLESIYSYPPRREFQVIVVDNGSTDGSVDRVRAEFPQATVIETGENAGYGRANNRALIGAGGEYYAILNSDLILQEGSLDACCDYLDRHPEAGIVGGELLNPNGWPQMDWAAGELTVRSVFCEQLFLAQAFPRSRVFGDYFRTWWPRSDTRALPQVCGAFMVVRGALFDKLGGFDPAYFMYCEDTDLCKRITNSGFECVYLNSAPSIHGHGKSSAGQLRPRMVLEHNRSRYYYLEKFQGEKAALRARSVMLWGSRLRNLFWTLAGILSRRKDWIDKGRGYLEVLGGTRQLGSVEAGRNRIPNDSGARSL